MQAITSFARTKEQTLNKKITAQKLTDAAVVLDHVGEDDVLEHCGRHRQHRVQRDQHLEK